MTEEHESEFVPDEEATEQEVRDRSSSLKKRLDQALKERQDYLDGWQRAKAELINYRKRSHDEAKALGTRELDSFLKSLFPILDSFEAALEGKKGEAPEADSWGAGIENIYKQMSSLLAHFEVESYGEEGDPFDPEIHEPVGKAEGEKEDLIADVLQKGYRRNDRVLRTAKVLIT
ncbi:MAG: nucleotide exchange factor GrpE [Candidatus Paceibacterota bacterium]